MSFSERKSCLTPKGWSCLCRLVSVERGVILFIIKAIGSGNEYVDYFKENSLKISSEFSL
jgi:hypothetical protein